VGNCRIGRRALAIADPSIVKGYQARMKTVLSETAGCTYLKLAETMFQRQCAKSTSHDEQIDGF
jgi:hypothetical protein